MGPRAHDNRMWYLGAMTRIQYSGLKNDAKQRALIDGIIGRWI